MRTIDYLLTTVGKTKEEILKIVCDTKIKGSFIVGNQLSKADSLEEFDYDENHIKIINMQNKGVSKNRNALLASSNADFIIFLDDDVSIIDNMQSFVENEIQTTNFKSVRFNYYSSNVERQPKKQLSEGPKKFMDVKSFSVNCQFFDRRFLLTNNIKFDEETGPGTKYLHGEDTMFNYFFTLKAKIYQKKEICFLVSHKDSTWAGASWDPANDLISQGRIYKIMFKWKSFLYGLYYILKHKKKYNKFSLIKCIKLFKVGERTVKNNTNYCN